MSNNDKMYVIKLPSGLFYRNEGPSGTFLMASIFFLDKAIKTAKELDSGCQIYEYIPAQLGEKFSMKNEILNKLQFLYDRQTNDFDIDLVDTIMEMVENDLIDKPNKEG